MRKFVMPLKVFLGLATASVVFPAAPAKAIEPITQEKIEKVVRNAAQCMVKRSPAKAAEAVLADDLRETPYNADSGLIPSTCLQRDRTRGFVRFATGPSFGYALAEELVRAQLAKQVPSDLDQVAPLNHRDIPDPQAKFSDLEERIPREALISRGSNYSQISRFGECVVRQNPAASHGFLLSNEGTEEERARLAVLRPVLDSCLTPGNTMKVNRRVLRGSLATNYYRLAKAPRTLATRVIS